MVAAAGNPLRCTLRHGPGHILADDLKGERPGKPGVLLPLNRSTRRTSIHIGARHKDQLPAQTVEAIAEHEKWSKLMNIRVAVLRHPHSPAERVLSFLPDLPLRDLEELSKQSVLPEHVRDHVRGEIASRK